MRCKNCHYSLENLAGPPHRCPECGKAFDPATPYTYFTEADLRAIRGLRRRMIWIVIIHAALCGALAWVTRGPVLLLFVLPPVLGSAFDWWIRWRLNRYP